MNPDLEAACLHEAAHCVVAHVLGLDPAGCFVDQTSQTGDGDRMSGGTVVDTLYADPFEAALVALAGYGAGEIVGMNRAVNRQRSADDLFQLEGIMRDVPEDQQRKVGATVADLLRANWALVLAVSAMLSVQGEVTREDLARLAGTPETPAQAPTGAGYAILARTEMESVYAREVRVDGPVAWWRLGAPPDAATAADEIGTRHLTYVDNPRSGEAIVARDPNGSTAFDHPDEGSGNVVEAAHTMPFTAFPFTLEFVFRSQKQADALSRTILFIGGNEGGDGQADRYVEVFIRESAIGNAGGISLFMTDDEGATSSQTTSNGRWDDKRIHHVAVVVDSATFATIYVDGADETDGDSVKSLSLPSGTVQIAVGNVGANYPFAGEFGADAEVADVAIYNKALSAARIAVHADAALAPWQGDAPDDRLGRILDLAEWPSDLRELNAGSTTFQSAETAGQTALEHAQKVGETEAGLFFVDRAGNVVLRDQAWQTARTPYPIVFGDGAGQIGFRSIRFDDGDEVLRNSATISRLNGAAKTDSDSASIDEFGRFQYTLDGLLHDTDAWSTDYAAWIVDEYASPRRRITEITVGPPKDGEEDLYLPAMLGLELGDLIDVSFTPSGLGDAVEQRCVIEGISHSSSPGRNRTVTFALSPEFGTALFG